MELPGAQANEFAVGVARIIAGKDALTAQHGNEGASQEQTDRITKNINDAISNDPGVKYHKAGDIEVHRIGAEVDKTGVEILGAAEASVYAAFGIPPQLFVGDTASGLREAWRTWRITVDALAALVAEELSAKLHPEAELSTAALRLTDVVAIARAVGGFVKAGMSIDDAMRHAGISMIYRSALLPRGSTRAWRKIRAAALKAVNHRCSVCGVKQLAGLQVHHRVKREQGGDDSLGLTGT